MSSSAPLPRNLIVFAILIPLALFIGYLLASPEDVLSFASLGIIILVLLTPLLLRWHHASLIVTWNMAVTVFFLPGQPSLWMLIAVGSLGISFLDWLLIKKKRFIHVPGLTWSLLALAVVTLFTAKLTGGIGIRSLGSEMYGGKQYLLIFLAIVGYFALAFRTIQPSHVNLLVGLYFLSAVTSLVSNLAYFGGPSFYFLYWVFPAAYALQQAQADWSITGTYARFAGFSTTGHAFI